MSCPKIAIHQKTSVWKQKPHGYVFTTRMYSTSLAKVSGGGHMLLLKIREVLNKEEHQFITIEEFCNNTGFKVDQVQLALVD